MMSYIVTLFGRISGIIFAFIASILVARYALINDAGTYFLLLSLSTFLVIPISNGLTTVVPRLFAKCESKEVKSDRQLAVVSFAKMSIITALALLVLDVGFFSITKNENFLSSTLGSGEWIATGAITAAIGMALSLITADALRFIGLHNLSVLFNGSLSNFIFVLMLGYSILVFGQINVVYLFAAYVVSAVIAGLTAVYFLYRNLEKLSKFRLTIREIIKVCIAAMMVNLFAYLITQAQGLFVGVSFNSKDTAVFGAAGRLAILMTLMPSVLQSFVSPVIARYWVKEDIVKIQMLLRGSTTLSTLAVLPFFLLFSIFSEKILEILFGQNYIDAATTLRILVLAGFVNIIRGASGFTLVLCGYVRQQMFAIFIGGCISVVLLYFACMSNNLILVASAVVISTVIQGAIEAFLLFKLIGINASFDFTMMFKIREFMVALNEK